MNEPLISYHPAFGGRPMPDFSLEWAEAFFGGQAVERQRKMLKSRWQKTPNRIKFAPLNRLKVTCPAGVYSCKCACETN